MRSPTSYLHRSRYLALIVVATVASIGAAQDADDTDWRAVARGVGLSEADIHQLDTNRILITNKAYKQIYEAYPNGAGPSFITSDSLLNAYHVLYEESILKLEQAGAQRLPEILRFILANLDTASAEFENQAELMAARQRAIIVLGTALKLLDDDFALAGEPLMVTVKEEVAKIVAAQITMKPEWLGPPEPDFLAVDYTRFKVRGFYTKSEMLTRYFRAVAWLQSIPFRISHDDELLTILLLGRCLAPERFGGDLDTCEAYRNFFRTYTEFLGAGDDWDLVTATDAVAAGPEFDLDVKRAELIAQAEQEGGPEINDQLRFAPDDPNAAAEPNFRIVSAYRLPESVLFQRTTDIRQFRARPFPKGLEVCIALGSAFARARIQDAEKDKLLATIDANLGLFTGTSLYFDYLNMVATLLDVAEPNAPPFMATDPWQAKSCGTALAGWAQLRHTWVLQAKLNVSTLGSVLIRPLPPGFVEPEPEFFARMARLAARTRKLLARADAFGSNYLGLVETLTDCAELLDRCDTRKEFWQTVRARTDSGMFRLGTAVMALTRLSSDDLTEDNWTATMAGRLRRMAQDLSAGNLDRKAMGMVWLYDSDVEQLWSKLEAMSRRLESIARKQLAGTDIDREDVRFIKDYGASLAAIMLYGGNSAAQYPEDDAPRIADVYSNAELRTNLHVGIGRARALYVLYPWDGDVVLCRGAVMPYYEFTDPGRLTDDEWKARLDSEARPKVPAWLRPIIGAEGLNAPVAETSVGRN